MCVSKMIRYNVPRRSQAVRHQPGEIIFVSAGQQIGYIGRLQIQPCKFSKENRLVFHVPFYERVSTDLRVAEYVPRGGHDLRSRFAVRAFRPSEICAAQRGLVKNV